MNESSIELSKKWRGEIKPEYFKYLFFYYTLKYLGLNFSYFILFFVVFFYVFFHKKGRISSKKYFDNLKGSKRTFIESYLLTFKHFYTFGQILLDRTYISLGLKNPFKISYDENSSINEFTSMMNGEKGAILISSHMGNFELAGSLMKKFSKNIYLMMLQIHDPKLKNFLAELRKKRGYEVIDLNDPLTASLEAVEIMKKGHIVSVMGDRDIQKKSIRKIFLGKNAYFPIAPFLLSSYANTPIFFIWCFKEKNFHYKVIIKGPYNLPENLTKDSRNKEAEKILDVFITQIQNLVKEYPYQWFNFFDFWEEE